MESLAVSRKIAGALRRRPLDKFDEARERSLPTSCANRYSDRFIRRARLRFLRQPCLASRSRPAIGEAFFPRRSRALMTDRSLAFHVSARSRERDNISRRGIFSSEPAPTRRKRCPCGNLRADSRRSRGWNVSLGRFSFGTRKPARTDQLCLPWHYNGSCSLPFPARHSSSHCSR